MPISAVNLRCRVFTLCKTARLNDRRNDRRKIHIRGGGLTRGKTLHRRRAAGFAAAIGDVAAGGGVCGGDWRCCGVVAAIGDVAVGGGDRRRCIGILEFRRNWV